MKSLLWWEQCPWGGLINQDDDAEYEFHFVKLDFRSPDPLS